MDTHGLDKQRAYNIACMMIGQDQARFKDFADRLGLPQQRREQCAGEYAKARDSWFSVLQPHLADDSDRVDFKLAYLKTEDPDLDYYRGMIEDVGVLEMLRDTFSGLVTLKGGIRLTVTVCGQANAFWSPGERQLIYCIEDARSYATSFAARHAVTEATPADPLPKNEGNGASAFLSGKTGGDGGNGQ